MAPYSWNAAKAKVQLRLSVQRLRTLQQKKEAQAKASRRDVATLIERGKTETARIKVEGLIHDDTHLELLELLELYCELLLARFGVLDQSTREPDPAVSEAVCSIIYAAPRTELKELHVLRDILMHKYGRDFSASVMDNINNSVSDRVLRKTDVSTPSTDLVDAYLTEIAKGYGISWSANPSKSDDTGLKDSSEPKEGDTLDSIGSAVDEKPSGKNSTEEISLSTDKKSSTTPPSEDDFDALAKRFAALKKR